MAKKLKAGSKNYNKACALFALDQLDFLVAHCSKAKKQKWIGAYINIMDCLTDIVEETDEMLDTIEDYEAACEEVEDAD